MAIEIKLKTLLSGLTTITNTVSTRIFVSNMPDLVAYPAISYRRVTTEPVNGLEGFMNAEKVSVDINAWATSYRDSFILSTAIEQAIFGSTTFKGIMISNQMLSQNLSDNKKLYNLQGSYNLWES